jgi:RNA polymerase sigma-70 factor, ECF subfamily
MELSDRDAGAAIAAARERFPDVAYAEADFVKDVQHLALSRIDPDRVGDLFLAFACVRGDARAIAHFENTVIARLDGALARVDPRPEAMDEARQRVRERLLVAEPGRAPRLAEYRGEAPLWSWVKTVAVRLLIDSAREGNRSTALGDEVIAQRLVTSGRVDMRFVQEAHRPDVTRAFEAALASLDPKERNVLRLAHVEGQSIDRIATLYGTHRATAARWVVAAREKVAEATRAGLRTALKLESTELDSLLHALDGNLDQSLRHFFDDDGA